MKRDIVEPSGVLQSQIFPELDAWFDRYNRQDLDQTSLSLVGFLKLLKYFRKVVLQDSVLLRRRHPELFIWAHPVFQSHDYNSFAQELEMAMQEAQEPAVANVMDVVPEIANALNNLSAEVGRVNTKIAMLNTRMDRLSRGYQVFNVMQSAIQEAAVLVNDEASESGPSNGESAHEAAALPHSRIIALPQQTNPTVYRMRRDPKMTVLQLWTEFTVGIEGGPAVRTLEEQGKTWRSDAIESRFFRNRRTILEELQVMIDNGLSEEAAVNVMEQRKGSRTIDWLIKDLRRERTERRQSEQIS